MRVIAAGALVVTTAVAAFVEPASAVHDAGALELDTTPAAGANLVDDDGTDDAVDWASLFVYDAIADETTASGDMPPGFIDAGFDRDFIVGASGPDSSYFRPSTKDDQSVNADGKASEVWGCSTAANPTDKNDILNAYSMAVVAQEGPDAGDTILFTGGERFANEGTAFWGVWYFQTDVGCDASSGTSTFTGQKQDGDVLLLINFDGGGSNVSIDAFNWHPCDAPGSPIAPPKCMNPADNAGFFTPALGGAVGGDCAAAGGGDDVCATVNRQPVMTPWPTQDKTSGANTLAISEFFESGFNLTDAFNVAPGEEPCISSFLLETRSSSSIDATLKDFAGGNLETCGSLTVHKYHDLNADGDEDAGEPGLSGWTVYLDDNDNGMLDPGEASAVTDSNGDAGFENVKSGNVTVCEVLDPDPADDDDWINSDPGMGTPADPDGTTLCKSVAVSVNQESSAEFGNYLPGDVGGKKFQDDDDDGTQDPGEVDLADVWVHLFGTTGYGSPVHLHTQTVTDGSYSFVGLQPGSYTLCESIPSGYKQTAPTTGPDCSTHTGHAMPPPDADGIGHAVTLTSGEDLTADFDFANAPLLGGIEIVKTRKHAADAQADPPVDPSPHAGVTFTITGGDLPLEGINVVTGADGTVCTDGLVISQFAGEYTVTEAVPGGYIADGDVAKTATVEESSCADADTVVVNFSNTPLTDIDVSVDSQVDGGTASTISCVDGDGVVVAEDLNNIATNDPGGGDVSVGADDLAPGTYVCTIVIDP